MRLSATHLSAGAGRGRPPFHPRQIPGLRGWYDRSDLSTQFQDSAGSTPATAVEQQVGRTLDKSGQGNHETQTTLTSRPILRARYNALTQTENPSSTDWTKAGVTVTGNLVVPTDISTPFKEVFINTPVIAGVQYKVRFSLKDEGYRYIQLIGNGAQFGVGYVNIDLQTGSVVISIPNNSIFTAPTIRYDGEYWIIEQVVQCIGAGIAHWTWNSIPTAFHARSVAWAGDGVSGVRARDADFRAANDALGMPEYQRVTTPTDYDTAGFASGEFYDGFDDHKITTTGGGSTAGFFWCSSLRVGRVGAVQTLFSDAGTNTGYRVRINASNQLELSAGNGTAFTTVATAGTLAIGQRAVLTAWDDGTTNLNVQINQGAVASVARPAVAAGTAQITTGKDNNAASGFFLGFLYQTVYAASATQTASSIAQAQRYCAQKAMVTL